MGLGHSHTMTSKRDLCMSQASESIRLEFANLS